MKGNETPPQPTRTRNITRHTLRARCSLQFFVPAPLPFWRVPLPLVLAALGLLLFELGSEDEVPNAGDSDLDPPPPLLRLAPWPVRNMKSERKGEAEGSHCGVLRAFVQLSKADLICCMNAGTYSVKRQHQWFKPQCKRLKTLHASAPVRNTTSLENVEAYLDR